MNQSISSYARRGDRERRQRRLRRVLLGGSLVITGALVLREQEPTEATAAPANTPLTTLMKGRRGGAPALAPVVRAPGAAPTPVLTGLAAELEGVDAKQLRRWHRVYRYAGHYGIAPDLAGAIHDVALAEGIEPELAFRLVHAESEFNERATSRVGAVGLTQLMPGTARHYVAGVSRKQLYDRHLNLRIGFRYLRGLIHQYKSLRVALLVYNRGPVAVEAALQRGDDPANGYEELVAKGYTGRGTVSQ